MRDMRLAWLGCALTAALTLTAAACRGTGVDIAKAVEVSDISTGWYDAGIVEGDKNKLVPTVGFRLKNVADSPVKNLQINAVFRRAGEPDEWGSSYTKVIGTEGLAPGGATDPVVLRSNLGYTSTEPRLVMLGHSQFKDVHVRVFAKQGGAAWTAIGEWDVERTMLAQENRR